MLIHYIDELFLSTNGNSLLFLKAIPDAVFKYFSKSSATFLSANEE
jgi:hypothetical protein